MRQIHTAGVIPALFLPLGLMAAHAGATVTITQSGSAPQYASTLTFDEVGGATGSVTGTEWLASTGVSFTSGEGSLAVSTFNTNPGFGWLGTGNAMWAPFGANINFNSDVSAFSCQYWDSSGPASFSGGGAVAVAYDDGVEVGSFFLDDPAYGGVGNTWINVVGSGGMNFDSISLFGFGFFPEAYIDNLSWNKVPAPGTAGLLALGGVAVAGRRRR